MFSRHRAGQPASYLPMTRNHPETNMTLSAQPRSSARVWLVGFVLLAAAAGGYYYWTTHSPRTPPESQRCASHSPIDSNHG